MPQMQLASSIGTSLLMLGLALMIGGMLALGAFTAPLVFKTLPREEAGFLMGQIFGRYDKVLIGAVVLCLLGEGLRFWSGFGKPGILMGLREVILAILSLAILYNTLVLTPKIQAYQAQRTTQSISSSEMASPAISKEAFDQTHKQAEGLYKLQLLLAVLLVFLTCFQQGSLPTQETQQNTLNSEESAISKS
jgi:hypothetical protein